MKGKVVVLEFWATWSPPCRASIPGVERLYEKYRDNGVVVLAVSMDDGGWNVVQSFVKENGMKYTVLKGTDDVATKYQVSSIPMLVVIDKEGNIVKRYLGFGNDEDVDKDIDAICSRNISPGPSPLEINQFREATKMSPESKDAWTNFGNALMDTQRYSEAIEAYQKALALDPQTVSVLVDLGSCYRGIGKFDKAVEEYRKALKIDPNFPNGHRNLAVVLSGDLHQNKEAVKEFQKYLELMPDGPDADAIKQTIRQILK